MTKGRTTRKRSARQHSTRHQKRLQHQRALGHAVELVYAVCHLAGDEHLIGNQWDSEIVRLRRAINDHDTPTLYQELIFAFSMQGISDHVALSYIERHGQVAWRDVKRATRRTPICPKLRCWWTYPDGCGYQKSNGTCANPEILPVCPVPKHDLRNGRLNQTAYSLFMFIRDVADGDLVGWIDSRLKQASDGSVRGRAMRIRSAVVEPLCNIHGVSHKVANMTLAWLLTSAPPNKPLWLAAGANMIAIDTLVHNFLHRTGILSRFDAEHAYGPPCYEPNGCADIIARVSRQIDAREFNPNYPQFFPRFVQHAIWRYCAQGHLGICNGNQIDDHFRCDNRGCPLFGFSCDRVALQPIKA